MSFIRAASGAVEGILDGVDQIKSPFERREAERKRKDAEEAKREKQARAKANLAAKIQQGKANIQQRRDQLPVSVDEARAASSIENDNADQATNRQLNVMGVAADETRSTIDTTGRNKRDLVKTTYGAEGDLATTKAQTWKDMVVPGSLELLGAQHRAEQGMVDSMMGSTPLVESLLRNQQANREHQLALADKSNQINMRDIAGAVLGAGLLFT